MIVAVFDMSVAFFHGKERKVIKSLYGTRHASQVFATYVEEGLNDHGFQRNTVVPCLYWGAMLEALAVH